MSYRQQPLIDSESRHWLHIGFLGNNSAEDYGPNSGVSPRNRPQSCTLQLVHRFMEGGANPLDYQRCGAVMSVR
jgi:hypothetical protein